MTKRWKFIPEFTAAGMVPILYFVMTKVEMDSSDAQVYSAAAGALYWAISLWWRGQAPLREDQQTTLIKSVAVAALITTIAFLIETITAELVLDIASVALNAADASHYDAEHVRVIVNRYFAIPLGLCFLFALGFWAAKKLRVRHPLLWFLGIVVAWYAIRLSLYGVALKLGRESGFNMPALGTAALHTIPVAVLSYTALIVGNFFGRRKYGRPGRPPTRPDDQIQAGAVGTGPGTGK
jgi:hypothetical protein